MQDNNFLFVPRKIKVGYQHRADTYTKFLAYVIYYDQKNVLRKETSWKGWIHDENTKIGYGDNAKGLPADQLKLPEEFDNIPTSGFVLNKGVGGVRQSWSWNPRNEYIRVYDPRGIEFEISVANLLFILQETNSIVGKGLEGEFVYAWEGKDLVLLPTNSYVYKRSKEYSDNLFDPVKKISKRELKPLTLLEMINDDEAVYMGKVKITGDEHVELYYNITGDYFFKNNVMTNIKRIISYDYNDIDVFDFLNNSALSENYRTYLKRIEYKDLIEHLNSKNGYSSHRVDYILNNGQVYVHNSFAYNWDNRSRYVAVQPLQFNHDEGYRIKSNFLGSILKALDGREFIPYSEIGKYESEYSRNPNWNYMMGQKNYNLWSMKSIDLSNSVFYDKIQKLDVGELTYPYSHLGTFVKNKKSTKNK